jgi:hypothetical protein
MGEDIVTWFLVGKIKKNRLEDVRRSWEGSKMELEELGWENVERLIWLWVGPGGGML